jgi:hypothetical protein
MSNAGNVFSDLLGGRWDRRATTVERITPFFVERRPKARLHRLTAGRG